MLRKILSLILICTTVIGCCVGCSSSSEITTPTLPVLNNSTQSDPSIADGFETLGGTWAVGGLYYEKYLIDIHDHEPLEDLYVATYLFFYESGTFLYMNLFSHRGTYIRMDETSFILKTATVFTYDITEEGLVEKEYENSSKPSYLITILDENTLRIDDLDPVTGKAAVDSNTLLFVRENEDSNYIQENKTPLKNSSKSENSGDTQSKSDKSTMSGGNAQTTTPSYITSGMRNALKSAKNYLDFMSFSYSGLIDQLEFEGYSHSEAVYAADNCGADWYEQAAKSAKNYLDIMTFSRSSLIDQLEFEGYTHDQAVYGVDKAY